MLSNRGRLYTFDTRTLQVGYLKISDKVIDFSIDENTDTLYYVTASRNELLCVLHARLIVSASNELSVDDTIVYTELSVFTTRASLSRLTLDYSRESLFLFVVINDQMFSYEMKLSHESRALLQLCGGSCANSRKLQILRPWLNANDESSSLLLASRRCRSLNFLVSRDRLLDLELICPTLSPRVHRIEISRKSNWAEDFRRSNFTVREQCPDYLFSTLIDVNDLTISSNFIPLRLIVTRDESNDTRYLHMERIVYSNQAELSHHSAPADERLNHVTRHLLARVDKAWSGVNSIDSMYVRSEHLLNELPSLIHHMIKHRAMKKYQKLLNERLLQMNEGAKSTVWNENDVDKRNDTLGETDRIEYDKVPSLNTRTLDRSKESNVNGDENIIERDCGQNETDRCRHRHETQITTTYVIVVTVLVAYAFLSTVINIVQQRLNRRCKKNRDYTIYYDTPV